MCTIRSDQALLVFGDALRDVLGLDPLYVALPSVTLEEAERRRFAGFGGVLSDDGGDTTAFHDDESWSGERYCGSASFFVLQRAKGRGR